MATAKKVAGFKGLLKTLRDDYGYEGGDTVDEVWSYAGEIELGIGTKAALIKAHKEYMRANVEASDDGKLMIELEPEDQAVENADEQKMDGEEDEAAEKAAKASRYKAANAVAALQKEVRDLKDWVKNSTSDVSVSLPGEKEWKARKSRGRAGLDDADSAYALGNMVLASMTEKLPQRAAKARDELKRISQKTNTTLNIPDGAAVVDDELQRQIWNYNTPYGVLRDYAQVLPMSSNEMTIPKNAGGEGGGFVSYWNVEGTAPSLSDLTFGTINLIAREITVLGKMSRALLDDSVVNLGEYAAEKIAEIIHKNIDDAGFNGTGGATYGGIDGLLNQFGATATTDSRSVTGGGTATATTEANVRAVVSKLPTRFRTGAAWYGNHAQITNIIDRLSASISGGTTYKEVQNEGLAKYFLGYPVREVEVMPSDEDASGDKIDLLFGNLEASVAMGNRQDMSVEFEQHQFWSEKNIGVMGHARVAINVHELGATDAGSPIVALFQT